MIRPALACVLIPCLLLSTTGSAEALGEYFEGGVMANRRLKAVDSSASATLMTFFGNVAEGQLIQGTHHLVEEGGYSVAGGSWAGVTEYIGYIRTPIVQDACYRAFFDAFHSTGTAYQYWGSSLVCVHLHSPECGHCGPGTGNVCQQGIDEENE